MSAVRNIDHRRFGAVQSTSERFDCEWQHRSICNLHESLYEEAKVADSAILELYHYWQVKRAGSRKPSLREFSPKASLAPKLARWISYADLTASYAPNFTVSDHAAYALGDFSSRRLTEHASSMHAFATAAEYHLIKTTGEPMFHIIEQCIASEFGLVERCYVRLMVPISSSNGMTEKIAYAIRYLSTPSSTAA